MTNEEFNELFRQRTMIFSLKVIEFLETVPFNAATRVLSFQLCKAATSVGASGLFVAAGQEMSDIQRYAL